MNDGVDELQDWKPRVILEYNACKGEVDAMDKMVQEYSCCRNTKRCPLLLLMNMMDVAAVNAFVQELNPSMYWTRCNLHRAALASKVLPDNLKNVLDISVKIVNHVKSRLLQCHYLLEVLCKDMESNH
ncbi:Zinc finger BED domain-containing protein 5 [Trichinella pseudospiralis]|uniref:Zinc finger BED domain-containing protein 5 n=1 Tax=Trichinella pseudospiralis TaxID=6337 RepID=A0A0V1G5X2_TRIPS|nr:Zinc finger BED domain-containing protein 5 [Trichinella pseudospiralis]